jgi:hypothetical protein
MNCKHRKQIERGAGTPYASSADFCWLFAEKMNSFYCLAFLLTADHRKAEKCFVAGLDDCVQSDRIFQSWARRWAKRTIIENAIHALNPRSGIGAADAANHSSTLHAETDSEFSRVLALGDFERFVFVMSVLERHSDYECSILLDTSVQEIRDARSRAFQEISVSVSDAESASFVRLRREDGSVAVHMR